MRLFAVAVVAFLFTSCGIQHLRIEKRHYRSGFYFDFGNATHRDLNDPFSVVEEDPVPVDAASDSIPEKACVIAKKSLQLSDSVFTHHTIVISCADNEPRPEQELAVPQQNSSVAVSQPAPERRFDWELFWLGLIFSLILPFVMPLAQLILSGSDWEFWFSLGLFLLSIAAIVTTVLMISLANPLWYLGYAACVLISMGSTMYLSWTIYGNSEQNKVFKEQEREERKRKKRQNR